jgi:hypothetical protein
MFEKLDAYDILANLIPGAALTYALHHAELPTPAPDSLGAFLLVSFVVGVTTNRIGSILLDPFLRAIRFLKPKDYPAFVTAEKKDPKLSTIVANHGLYRTFLTAGLLYSCLIALKWAFPKLNWSSPLVILAAVIAGTLVFARALRKEDGYIHDRIEAAKHT